MHHSQDFMGKSSRQQGLQLYWPPPSTQTHGDPEDWTWKCQTRAMHPSAAKMICLLSGPESQLKPMLTISSKSHPYPATAPVIIPALGEGVTTALTTEYSLQPPYQFSLGALQSYLQLHYAVFSTIRSFPLSSTAFSPFPSPKNS